MRGQDAKKPYFGDSLRSAVGIRLLPPLPNNNEPPVLVIKKHKTWVQTQSDIFSFLACWASVLSTDEDWLDDIPQLQCPAWRIVMLLRLMADQTAIWHTGGKTLTAIGESRSDIQHLLHVDGLLFIDYLLDRLFFHQPFCKDAIHTAPNSHVVGDWVFLLQTADLANMASGMDVQLQESCLVSIILALYKEHQVLGLLGAPHSSSVNRCGCSSQ